MSILVPQSAEELADLLRENASAGRTIRAGGAFSKNAMAGPIPPADITISTSALTRVFSYEPKDLTISVGAGLPFAELSRMLAANHQILPLDPPLFEQATTGGVIAANNSGPRRRVYGTARDVVIGMTFATLEGKLVQTGGMVVKNVAGLDMGKLMIGSFGTLAVITSVNFKLIPAPPYRRTFVQTFRTLDDLLVARGAILSGVLQPAAIDALNPAAARRIGLDGYALLLEAGGNRAVIERYTRELGEASLLEGDDADRLWEQIREFTPRFLADFPDGAMLRIPGTLSDLKSVFDRYTVPVLARAGNGVCYAHFENAKTSQPEGQSVIDWSPERERGTLPLWPNPGKDFEIMKKIKDMFDPQHLLNRGRLYGRI